MTKRSSKQSRFRLTAEEKLLADQGWEEVGKNLARSILVGNKTEAWAWELLKPLDLYPRWMLVYWIRKYRHEYEYTKEKKARRVNSRSNKARSVFNSREDVMEALNMLRQRMTSDEVIEYFIKKNGFCPRSLKRKGFEG